MDPIQWLKEDIAEIKQDLKDLKMDVKRFDGFRLKLLGGAMVVSFLVATAIQIIVAYIDKH